MNGILVIIALVNGMIGGLILVLPILALQGGAILSLLVILATGFFSYYSCLLCLKHLGNHSDLDKAILEHFNNNKCVSITYDILVGVNLLFLLMLYFNLIVTQWQGLVGYNLAIPIVNAFVLFILTFGLNYFHFGAKLLGYGIISIIGYCVFLIWLVADAPHGENKMLLFGTGGVDLAASMGQAFAIQTFFIPVLRQIKDQSKYKIYTLIAYSIGAAVYLYIAYAGSFGILNRSPNTKNPSTIENYFHQGAWQIGIVQVIYLVHLYSAYGQFLLICKYKMVIFYRKRIFGVFKFRQSKHGSLMNITQIIFVIFLIAITMCTSIYLFYIGILIQINGAIIGFFFIYLLPAVMHFKCLYLPQSTLAYSVQMIQANNITISQTKRDDVSVKQENNLNQSEIKQKMIELSETQGRVTTPIIIVSRSLSNFDNPDVTTPGAEQRMEDSRISEITDNRNKTEPSLNINRNLTTIVSKKCQCKKSSKLFQVFDVTFLIGMVGLGAFIMVDGFISVIQTISNPQQNN